MRRIIINTTIILIAFAIQNCAFPFIPFLSAAPNLMIIFVFTCSFIYGQREGMFYGFITGVLMDLFYSGPFGFFTIIFVWIGYVNGTLSKYFYEDYIVLLLAICSVNEIVYNLFIFIFRFFVRGKADFLYYFRIIILPEMIITLLFTLFLYRFLLAYNRKLEEIDIKRGQKVA